MTGCVSRDLVVAGDQFEVTVQVYNYQGLKIAKGTRLNLARGGDMLGLAIRRGLLQITYFM
jgi:hypothetical protein